MSGNLCHVQPKRFIVRKSFQQVFDPRGSKSKISLADTLMSGFILALYPYNDLDRYPIVFIPRPSQKGIIYKSKIHSGICWLNIKALDLELRNC